MHIQPNEKLVFGLLLVWLGFPAFGQQSSRYIRPEEPGQLAFTLGAGTANYLGDLNERAAFRRGEFGFALAGGIAYRISDHLLARAEARVIRLTGSQQETNRRAIICRFEA